MLTVNELFSGIGSQRAALEQARLIYKDTYNFYLKWKDINKDEDWNMLVEKEHGLYKKYPFKLCGEMLVEIMDIIEKTYQGR